MTPYAKKASKKLGGGVTYQAILTQWSLETGYGTSRIAKEHNNHAGIKNNSHGADYDAGTYAGYNSLDSFVNDYVRVMNLSYYDDVRKEGSTADDLTQLHKSPWATDPKYGEKLKGVFEGLNFSDIKDVELDNKAVMVGIGAVTLLALLK